MAVTSAQVQELYVGYLGRPADQAGLNYWLNELNTEGTTSTLENVRLSFVASQEYATTYGDLDRAGVVSAIYTNLFGRTPSSDEVGYWTYSSTTSVDNLIVAFLAAASTNDRATVDAKTTYADALTAAVGTGSDAATIVAQQYQAVLASVTAEQSGANPPAYAESFTAYANAQLETLVFDPSTGAYNAFSNTDATITLDRFAGTAINITGDDLTSLTVNGSLTGSALDLANAGTDLADVTTLNLGLTTAATVNVDAFTGLTTLNGSTSTAALTLNTTALNDTLTSLTSGSGADDLTFASSADATDGAALTVDSGAGNDTLTGTVNATALTVNAGAGNDEITATVNAASLTINAGAGNDQVNVILAQTVNETTTITLGAGVDTLAISGVANVAAFGGSAAAQTSQINASLTTVTDFSVGDDTLDLSGLSTTVAGFGTFTAEQSTAIQGATSLAAALGLVATDLSATANAAANAATFVYGGNTYVYVDDAAAGATHTFGQGDTLIQLTGVTASAAEVQGAITA